MKTIKELEDIPITLFEREAVIIFGSIIIMGIFKISMMMAGIQ